MFDDKKTQSNFVSGKKKFAIHTLLYTEKVMNEATRAKNVLNERTSNKDKASASKNVTNLATKLSYINSSGNDKGNVPERTKSGIGSKIHEYSQGVTGSEAASMSSSGHISSSLSKTDKNIIEKIGVLANGCSYMVGNRKMRFVNTCSFDSIAQVTA